MPKKSWIWPRKWGRDVLEIWLEWNIRFEASGALAETGGTGPEQPARCSAVASIPDRSIGCGLLLIIATLGLGIALMPPFIVPEELRSGALKALNVGFNPEGANLNIAYPRHPYVINELLAPSRHLRLVFGSPPHWELTAGAGA